MSDDHWCWVSFLNPTYATTQLKRVSEPLQFVAKDVCEILTVQNHRDALAGLDDDEKGVAKIYTPGGIQKMLTLYEPGFYTLLIRSNKPEAKPFRRWVTHEVLPSIRKTGFYSLADSVQSPKIKSLSHMAEDDAAVEKMFRKRKKLLTELGFDKSEAVLKAIESIRKDTGIDLAGRFGFDIAELKQRVSGTPEGLHKKEPSGSVSETAEKSHRNTESGSGSCVPKNYKGWNLKTRGKNKKGEDIFNLTKKIGGKNDRNTSGYGIRKKLTGSLMN
ncbi:BRO-N domain-containing protein [Desulfonema magnum]|nr:Bro-N domain-containing protein [Desulfonema magnum]